MYCYYEHHKDAHKKVVLTELRLSSDKDGKLYINHRDPSEQILKGLCISILKWPPIDNRSMDEKTWIWSFFGQYGVNSSYGEEVLKKLQQVTKPIREIGLIEVEDLAVQLSSGGNRVNLSGARKKMNAEEFFYNNSQPVQQVQMTKETLLAKLSDLIGPEITKSAYRIAALKYHPDRNQGDGSKMSELNMLWRMYNT